VKDAIKRSGSWRRPSSSASASIDAGCGWTVRLAGRGLTASDVVNALREAERAGRRRQVGQASGAPRPGLPDQRARGGPAARAVEFDDLIVHTGADGTSCGYGRGPRRARVRGLQHSLRFNGSRRSESAFTSSPRPTRSRSTGWCGRSSCACRRSSPPAEVRDRVDTTAVVSESIVEVWRRFSSPSSSWCDHVPVPQTGAAP